MLESGFPAVVPISYPEPSCFLLRMLDESMRSKKIEGSGYEIVVLRECLLPLFLCFIGCFTAYRLNQFIEEVLVNGLSFKITLFGLAQFSSDNFGPNFGRHFSHSEQ